MLKTALLTGLALAVASEDVVLPCYHIPFRRNTRFVGRGAELDAIKDLLFGQRCPSVAIVGLGGVGKTQVALELAYWTKETHQEYSILWVPALSEATFEQAYAEIARELKIRKISDDEDVKVSVRRYLSSEIAGPWLFILDNADDADMVLHSPGGLSQYLPESERGLILYTTRSPDVASRATDEIELQKMSRQEAKSMLERSLKRKGLIENEARVEELIEELASLPLAIAQAAAYLDRNRLSVDDYLKLLRGTEDDMVSAMSREFHDSTRYPGSQNAVATTWLVSMDQIRRFDPIAAELLSFISQIEPKAIPQSILPKLGSDEMMVHSIGTLCGYAFLERREGSDLLDMHSLVHVVTRLWIERHDGADATGIVAVRHLEAIFPHEYREYRTFWRGYLPHALRLLYGIEGCRLMERQKLLFRVGQCLHLDRRFKEAIRCFEEVYNWTKERLTEDDDFRLAVELELGSSYLDDRRIKEATEMLEHIVAARKKTLPEENPDRLSSEHELARAYLSVSRIKEAIEILEHVVAARKNLAPEDDSRLTSEDEFQLTSEQELASAYLADGRTREAIEIFEYVVAGQRKILAPEDEYRLVSEHELARAYLEDGRTREAIEIFEHIVAVQRKNLAPEDDYRLISETNLAKAYLEDGRTREAIEILEHVVAVRRKNLALEDDSRLLSEYDLAYAYLEDGRTGEAIELLEHVVAGQRKILAQEDHSRLLSEHELARAYLEDGRTREAIEIIEHVVTVKRTTLAPEDDSRLISEHNLATAYLEDGRTGEAIEIFEHVVAVLEKTVAEEDELRSEAKKWLAYALAMSSEEGISE